MLLQILHNKLIVILLQNFGHIDIVVSNAAANPSVDNILEMKEPILDKLWDINVKASILLLQVNKIFILNHKHNFVEEEKNSICVTKLLFSFSH